MEKTKDNVKHPPHYAEGRAFEPKDVIRDWGLNFNLGNAVKYLARAGRKDDIVQDLKKAQQYIQFEIEAIEAERSKAVKPKAPQHPNCRCTINPDKPVEDPAKPLVRKIGIVGGYTGIPTEMVIKKIIEDIYGVK